MSISYCHYLSTNFNTYEENKNVVKYINAQYFTLLHL